MASFGHDIIFIVEISFFGDGRMLYRMAGYCRLSKEDGENRISESIENQKKLILEYVDKAGDMQLVRMYVDDGYSGLYFSNRPQFHRWGFVMWRFSMAWIRSVTVTKSWHSSRHCSTICTAEIFQKK